MKSSVLHHLRAAEEAAVLTVWNYDICALLFIYPLPSSPVLSLSLLLTLLILAMKNLTDLDENTPQMQFLIKDAKYVIFFSPLFYSAVNQGANESLTGR